MSNVVPLCAKCGKQLEGKVKIAGGKRYHEACAPTPSVAVKPVEPVEVQQTALGGAREQAYEDKPPSVESPEARHVAFFAWQGQDGTVFNQTVRGVNFLDFVDEWNAILGWILAQGGAFVNAGKSSYAEAPKTVAAKAVESAGLAASIPQSVSDQTATFESDGVKYMVGRVKEINVKVSQKGEIYLSVKVPPFLQFGVAAYKEIAVPVFGDLQEYPLDKPVPIPAGKEYVVFSLKEDGKPNKVVDFRATKTG